MKTKKMRIFSKLFAALVVLTLISCCFMGTTFARYTSTGTGTATVGVAKWDVDITAEGKLVEGTTTLSFDKLSPSDAESNGTANRQKYSELMVAATITNKSEVDAEVTISAGAIQLSGATMAEDNSTEAAPTKKQVASLFTLKLYTAKSDKITDLESGLESGDLTEITANSNPVTLKAKTADGALDALYVYAVVIWTSQDVGVSDANGWVGDQLDTWAGINLTSVSWVLKYIAVQASELPNASELPGA